MITFADLFAETFGRTSNTCSCGNKIMISYFNPDGQELHLCHICYFRLDVGPVETGHRVHAAKNAIEMLGVKKDR
jgi:hypothetical protein